MKKDKQKIMNKFDKNGYEDKYISWQVRMI